MLRTESKCASTPDGLCNRASGCKHQIQTASIEMALLEDYGCLLATPHRSKVPPLKVVENNAPWEDEKDLGGGGRGTERS